MTGFAAVVLAGGAARRMGGTDKPARTVGGRSMRDRVLDAVADASPRILVGPTAPAAPGGLAAPGGPADPGGPVGQVGSAGPVPGTGHRAGLADAEDRPAPVNGLPADVRVTRERPAGGGPVAAAAAGLALLDADSELVALLAADLPLLSRSAIAELRRQLTDTSISGTTAGGGAPEGACYDGACYVDADGRRQTLCGVWRVAPLRAAVRRLRGQRGGDLTGAPVRALLAGLVVREVPWSGDGPPPWFDCDTDDDVRRAEEWTR